MQKLSLISLSKSQQRVKRQLVEAMIFERLIPFEEGNGFFRLIGKNNTYTCKGKRTAFDRVRIEEESIEAMIEELLDEVVTCEDVKQTVLHELAQTTKLCEWNEEYLIHSRSRRHVSYEELESELIEGHPYHPCFKSRTGFSSEDHFQYGPEAKQSFPLIWTAVRRDRVKISIHEDEEQFWRRELGHLMWEYLVQQLEMVGKDFRSYTFLPVHPWQWNSLEAPLQRLVEKGDLYPFKIKGDDYRATQSVRTLWNASHPKKAHVKVPMNMVNTSSLRTIPTHAICSAPYLSEWIGKIVQSDTYLKNSLIILKEYAGIGLEESEPALEGQLGVIWRESIHLYKNDHEGAIPFNAFMMSEKDGKPFMDEMIKSYGIERWVKQFIEVSVIPILHLLIGHGVAVEAHAQNMILLHENGWPTKIALRDFHDSLEYVEEFVVNKELIPTFESIHPYYKDKRDDVSYWMSSVEALRELVMDTLFVFNISEVSFLLEQQYAYKEETFYQQVGLAMGNYLRSYPELQDRYNQVGFQQEFISVEALLKRKLQKKSEGEFHHLVKNTLLKKEQV
ncbi:IucA/IucC family protein [Metabacillus sp. HB246100]